MIQAIKDIKLFVAQFNDVIYYFRYHYKPLLHPDDK